MRAGTRSHASRGIEPGNPVGIRETGRPDIQAAAVRLRHVSRCQSSGSCPRPCATAGDRPARSSSEKLSTMRTSTMRPSVAADCSVGIDDHGLDDVRDDEALEAQQDRPADALSCLVIRRLMLAGEVDPGPGDEGQQRAHDEDDDPCRLEEVDRALHHLLECHGVASSVVSAAIARMARARNSRPVRGPRSSASANMSVSTITMVAPAARFQ